MGRLQQWLERFFASSDAIQANLSHRWREHANRRTIVVSIVLGGIALYLWIAVIQPPETFPLDQLVTVPEGQTVSQVATTLYDDGVIRSPFAFRVLIRVLGSEHNVHAGDYLFKQPEDILTIARAMSIGAFGLEPIRIRIPEGASTKQMALIYDTRLYRFNNDNFLSQARPEEGYLFPDTYYFYPNATEDTIIKAMRQNFDTKLEPLMPAIASTTRSVSDIVTMASIVEREAYNTADRKMISGVLWNRIKRGMPLQVDATFAYTLGKGTFDLTMKDLTAADDPYNTYVHKGLPPTPIGSPSLDSIQAAINPTPNDYLYFLADHHGITHYCKTYSCQLANKYRYF